MFNSLFFLQQCSGITALISSLYLWNFFIFHMSKGIWTHSLPQAHLLWKRTQGLWPQLMSAPKWAERGMMAFLKITSSGLKINYSISTPCQKCSDLIWSKFDGQILLCSLLATLIRRLAQFVNSFSWELCKPSYCNNVKLTSLRNMPADS